MANQLGLCAACRSMIQHVVGLVFPGWVAVELKAVLSTTLCNSSPQSSDFSSSPPPALTLLAVFYHLDLKL